MIKSTDMKLIRPVPKKEEEQEKKPSDKKKIKKFEFKLNFSPKNLLIWALVLFLGFSFLSSFLHPASTAQEIDLSKALVDIKDNKVKQVLVDADRLLLTYQNGDKFSTRKEPGESLMRTFQVSNIDPKSVEIKVIDQTPITIISDILGTVLPLALMAIFFFYIFRQARGAQENIFSFGQSKARLFAKGKQAITFKDVAGVNEAKKELEEVVDFLKHPQKYRALGARTPKGALLIGPSGVGKCVTGETIVWTNKGLMEIREIPRYYYVDPRSHHTYGAGVAGFDTDNVASVNQFASHWYDLGEQKTTTIRLDQGFQVEGTPEHLVMVMTNDGVLRFRQLEQIQPGDYVAVQYGRNMFGNLQMVDTDTAYLMGLLTGDGNMSHASRVGLTNIDPEIIGFFENYVHQRFTKNAITVQGQSYLVASWDFKKMLYELGMSYLLSFDKTIPPTILQAPKETQVAFLQGLFDTDASVAKGRATMEYTTVSGKMARQVQMMLLNLGMVASLNIKGRPENGYYRDVYRVTMTGSGFVAFGENIGFRVNRKQKQLEEHIKRMGRVNTNVDVIPGIAKKVEESWRELSQRKLSNEKLSKTIDKVRRRTRISRQTLQDYVRYAVELEVEVPYLEDFRNLLEAKLFFSPVVKKTEGFNRVYDFTVPESHSFLGNGMINHNTLLAKAVAGEAGVPFFSMAGSEFMEMLVGVGASRVRDLFGTAKKAAPSIIFIDEIDAIGRQRGSGLMGGHDEREQTLNQILVEMDGFTPNDSVLVMAATNRGDLLDSALLRPGRFDRTVVLELPDLEGRKAILQIHARGKHFVKDVLWEKIAKRTVGFSGADLENMLNEAAILAARLNKKEIDESDIEEATVKVKLGPERKRLQSDDDKKMTAYHEAGHAVVSFFSPQTDPVHRISIVARGMSLGHTMIAPLKDRSHETKTRLLEQINVMMGGRAAEELIFSEMTTGAANDISQATRIARAMVINFGMSCLGPIFLGNQIGEDEGRMFYEPNSLSPEMQAKIDAEVKRLTDEAYKKAQEILLKNKKKLDKIAARLIEKETIEEEEFQELMK